MIAPTGRKAQLARRASRVTEFQGYADNPPWRVRKIRDLQDVVFVVNARGEVMCQLPYKAGFFDVGRPQAIAAMPEMLIALLALIEHAEPSNLAELKEDHPKKFEAWRLARAALQKAKVK